MQHPLASRDRAAGKARSAPGAAWGYRKQEETGGVRQVDGSVNT